MQAQLGTTHCCVYAQKRPEKKNLNLSPIADPESSVQAKSKNKAVL